MFIKIFYLLVIIILVPFYLFAPATMDKAVMSYLFILAFACLSVYMFTKEKEINLKAQFFKHSTLFLIGYFIVHFQYYLDFILGNAPLENPFIWINNNIVVGSMIISVIGLACFFLGYFTYKKSKVKIKQKPEKVAKINYLIFISIFALVVFFMTVNPLYLAGFYGAEEMGSSATYAILIYSICIFSIIVQNCRNMIVSGQIPKNFKEYIKSQGYILLTIMGVYLISVIVSGDRGPLITFSVFYLGGYFFVTRKKLSSKSLLVFIFVGASFITLLGVVRNQEKKVSFSERLLMGINNKAAFEEEETPSFFPQTQELASSVRTLHTTIDYIPQKHDFFYGRFQFQQITVVVPFFNIFSVLLFEDQSVKSAGSSSFVTWVNHGDNPTSGDGTSCLADFYFDFGLIGVIIGMFLFGYYIRFWEINTFVNEMPTLLVHIFAMVYLSNALYIPRSSVLFELKTVIWVYFLLKVNKAIFQKN
ncbi:O-antigen polysaccharide polymerase Wzy [Flavobacterium sp.]|uniref:O-antigen polysaccharide polymerase Wzy n=1 Tax=Flavobacterium sp. TaxID=239 RepID=UPI00263632A8|nr:O-antigen polysaccharide polymerase Wzy [Flavobacterium sp.]